VIPDDLKGLDGVRPGFVIAFGKHGEHTRLVEDCTHNQCQAYGNPAKGGLSPKDIWIHRCQMMTIF